MLTKIFRFIFLSVVFVSGVLIGGIYTPEITSYTEAEREQGKELREGIKPTKRKPAKRQRVVMRRAGITHS